MSFTPPDERTFLHREGSWVISLQATVTDTSATTYLVDSANWSDAGSVFISPQRAQGMWLLLPNASSASDRVRRIESIDVATHRVTVDYAWSTPPSTNDPYEIHSVDPVEEFGLLLNVMRRKYMPYYTPLERFTNANLQSVTGWSAVGGGTFTLDTTTANIQTGASSGLWSPSSSSSYLKTPAFRIDPQASEFVSVNLKVNTGGPIYLALWDETNNAEIQNSARNSSSVPYFNTMQRNFETPSGCYSATVRLYCTNATDRVSVDYCNGPWNPNDRVIDLESYVTHADQVRTVQTAWYSTAVNSLNGVFNAFSRTYDKPLIGPPKGRDYTVRIDPAAANPTKLELNYNRVLPARERWMEVLRRADDFTTFTFDAAGETVTCNLALDLIGYEHLLAIAQYVLRSVDASDRDAIATIDHLLGPQLPNGQRGPGGLLTEQREIFEADQAPPDEYPVTTGWGRLRF